MRFLHTIEDVKLVPDTKPWFPIREPYVYANKTLGGMVDALDQEQYEMLYGESAEDAGEQSDNDFLHPSPHEADGEPKQNPPQDSPEQTDSSPQPGTSGLDYASNDRWPRYDATTKIKENEKSADVRSDKKAPWNPRQENQKTNPMLQPRVRKIDR